MSDKISVITIVYNDVDHIRRTIESFLSQTWKDKEYIIIDGGSTDGTVDIIKEYADRLAYWCSEKDHGIYDAMNKGISHVTGDWINFLNCGDFYYHADSLEKVITGVDTEGIDVLYGDSVAIGKKSEKYIIASADPTEMEKHVIYRHGSSLVRTEIQRQYPFDISKAKKYGYSLDWDMIYRIFKSGHTFKKISYTIDAYQEEGTSNHPFRNLWYNYLVTSQGKLNAKNFFRFILNILLTAFNLSPFYRYAKAFGIEYMINDVLPHIPFWNPRKLYLRMIGMKISKGAFIMKRNYFMSPWLVEIGENSHINRGCLLDARGTIKIGNNVSVSHNVNIVTGGHVVQSKHFNGQYTPITIDDYAWLGIGCTILQNVHIGKGAVVCAGAVVTKDVPDYAIYAGVPAKKIGERNKDLDYICKGYEPLT